MRRTWEWLGRGIERHPLTVVLACLLATVVLAAGAGRLGFATGQDTYIDPDSVTAVDNREYQSLFGGQALSVLLLAEPGHDVTELFSPTNRERIAALQRQLAALPSVSGVTTPLSAAEWNAAMVTGDDPANPMTSFAGALLADSIARDPDPASKEIRTRDATVTLQRLGEVGTRTYDDPRWVDFLMYDNQGTIRRAIRPLFPVAPGSDPTRENARQAQIVVRLGGNQTSDAEGQATAEVLRTTADLHLDGFRVVTAGSPALLKEINDYLQKGMGSLGGVAVLVMIVVLSIVFRARWRLLPLVSMAAGVIWAFGLLGYTGFKLSIVTIAGLPILIGLGVEFAIQVHNRVDEEITLNHADSPLSATTTGLGPALLVATVSAVVAVLGLRIAPAPMTRDFGMLLAVGIALMFLASLVVPSSLVAVRERRSPTTRAHRSHLIERVMTTLGHAPRWSVGPLALAAVVLFGVGLLAEGATPIQTDPQRWVDQDAQVVRDLDLLDRRAGMSGEFGLYVKNPGGVFDEAIGRFVNEFSAETLARHARVVTVATSLPDVVASITEVPGATRVAPTGEQLKRAWELAPPEFRTSMVSADGKALNVIYATGTSTLAERSDVIEEVRERARSQTTPAPTTATPAGLAVVGAALLDNLTSGRLQLTGVALGAVVVWLLARFRNVVRAGLILVPVLLAVGLSAVVVKITGITVSPLTTVSGPLVIAVCGEFACLILFRHLEERSAGLAPGAAIDVAAARTGRAFFASSLTTLGGFLVLLTSPLPLLRDFGAIVAITIFIALLSAMVVLPPLLVVADEKGWLRARTSPPDVGDAVSATTGSVDLAATTVPAATSTTEG